MFRKKSDLIRIRRSDPIRFGSVLKFCDPKTDPNQKKTDPNGCGSDRIIPHINPDPIRSDSDQLIDLSNQSYYYFFLKKTLSLTAPGKDGSANRQLRNNCDL